MVPRNKDGNDSNVEALKWGFTNLTVVTSVDYIQYTVLSE